MVPLSLPCVSAYLSVGEAATCSYEGNDFVSDCKILDLCEFLLSDSISASFEIFTIFYSTFPFCLSLAVGTSSQGTLTS